MAVAIVASVLAAASLVWLAWIIANPPPVYSVEAYARALRQWAGADDD